VGFGRRPACLSTCSEVTTVLQYAPHCLCGQEAALSQGTTLIARYFDVFNRHDLEAVMACFDTEAVIVTAHGSGLNIRCA
jgi:hypothetical protein